MAGGARPQFELARGRVQGCPLINNILVRLFQGIDKQWGTVVVCSSLIKDKAHLNLVLEQFYLWP